MLYVWWLPSFTVQSAFGGNSGLIDLVSGASPIVIFTLLLLLFFSVTTWAIIFIKWRQIRTSRQQTASFLDAFWTAKSLSQIQSQLGSYVGSPVAEMFRVGYGELNRLSKATGGLDQGWMAEGIGLGGLENLRRSLTRAARVEMTRLSHSLTFLATTGNIAPFVGLFGTVVGIMNAFRGIGLQGSASLATVAPGISEALVATAAGLAAAIPAVIAYNHFLSRVRVLDEEMNAFSADFLNLVERDVLRKAQAKRSA